MATQHPPRKRQKTSPPQERPTPVAASSSKRPIPSTPAVEMAANATSNHHEQALKSLNTDLESMRQLVTCKICDKFLYEPFSLACGHTHCYSCLAQWLGNNVKMTCPDCRAVVKQQPTPSYIIRELVLVFASRNELLPDGETAEEHQKSAKEEAEIVAKDRANTDPRTGGLFKGRFNPSRMRYIVPLHDPGDGVDRCPRCHWELEEGVCGGCGLSIDGDEDDDVTAENLSVNSDEISSEEGELDWAVDEMEDEAAVWGADGEDHFFGDNANLGEGPIDLANYRVNMQRERNRDRERVNQDRRRRHQLAAQWRRNDLGASLRDNASQTGSDESDDGTHDGLVWNTEGSENGEEGEAIVPEPPVYRNRANPNNFTNSGTGHRNPMIGRPMRSIDVSSSEDEDSDEDDDNPEMDSFIDDEAIEEDEDSDAESVATVEPPRWQRSAPAARRVPIAISDDEAPSTINGEEPESDSEDEGPVVRGSQRVKRPNIAVRPRTTTVISDDDDDDSSSESDSEGTVNDAQSFSTAQGGFSPIDHGHEDEVADSEQSTYDEDDYEHNYPLDSRVEYFDPGDDDEEQFDDESEDGWGTDPPGVSIRHQPTAQSHRLGTLGHHSTRHASPRYTQNPASRHPMPRARPNPASMRSPLAGRSTNALDRHQPPTAAHAAFRPLSQLPPLPQALRNRERPFTQAFDHPFQLDNTLARINNTSNYNQRSQQARNSLHGHRFGSRSSAHGGGVAVQPSSSRSRATAEASEAGRRKRALSVSSDDSEDYYG